MSSPSDMPGITGQYAEDLDFALALADVADEISQHRFHAADLAISRKADQSFVTDADRAVEQALRERILNAGGNDGIFGEEFGVQGEGSRQWVIDPIDGTSNYLRGVPVWATLIALVVDGRAVLGVVSAPALRSRWWAAEGGGAWGRAHAEPPRRLTVSNVENVAEASISFQSIDQWRRAGHLDTLLALTDSVWRDRAYGDMWAYMFLAEGLIDMVAEFDVQPYDLAALVPIVHEAGGRFTSVEGVAGHQHGNSLATNGHLHEAMLAFFHGEVN